MLCYRSFAVFIHRRKSFKMLAKELIKCGGPTNQFIDINKILPSRVTVSRHVDKSYSIVKSRLISEVENVKYFGLTCDHWVHDVTKVNYLTVTLQYIKDENLNTRVISTKEVENKTSVTTKLSVNELLSDYGLTEASYIMVTDNASEMKSAFKDISWIGCSSHNMNLVQKHTFDDCTGINSIIKLIENCKELVTFAKHSGLQNQLDTTLKNMTDVRWDSRYDLLNSIKVNYQKLRSLSFENNRLYDIMRNIDERLLTTLIDFLLPLKLIRSKLCSESMPTLYHVLPDKEKLKIDVQSFAKNFTEFDILKDQLIKCIDKYLVVTDYHVCATFLTPIYRKLKMISSQNQINKYLNIISEMAKSFEIITKSSNNELQTKKQKISHIVSIYAETADDKSEETEIEEVLRYFNYPLSSDDLKLEPIKFWIKFIDIFTRLSQLALLVH